jgi:magnesium-protoporphyrin IX monomethyl ester (oxidative) cyclase
MNILLVVPPLRSNEMDGKKSANSIGLWYIGSYLQSKGHKIKILDCVNEGWDNLRKAEGMAQEYGLSDEEILKRVSAFKPDIIGINCLSTTWHPSLIETSKLLKNNFPESLVIVGGAHPSALPEKVLRDSNGAIDFVVIGEGELTTESIARQTSKEEIRQLCGVAYLDSRGNFRENPPSRLMENLDSVGKLDPGLISCIPFTQEPTYAGSTQGRKYIDVMLSRGCPRNCTFCYTPQMWKRIFRKHSLSYISEMFDSLKASGYSEIIVQDDNFSRGGDWAKGVMGLFKEKGLYWQNNGGLEMEHLTPELIDYMAATNCTTLFIPFNFRTEKTDNVQTRQWEHYKEILARSKQNGLYVFSSSIIGFPEQTLESMNVQVKLARDLVEKGLSDFHVVYAFSILPGTARWNSVMREIGKGEWEVRPESGVYFEGSWQNWARYSINTPQIGSKSFSFKEFETRFYKSIYEINGKEKADIWFKERQWVKMEKARTAENGSQGSRRSMRCS